jgi:hypothetical protein
MGKMEDVCTILFGHFYSLKISESATQITIARASGKRDSIYTAALDGLKFLTSLAEHTAPHNWQPVHFSEKISSLNCRPPNTLLSYNLKSHLTRNGI